MIAGGVIPSGREYSWRVPEDLKLDGDQETFTIQVIYETYELYGIVKGTAGDHDLSIMRLDVHTSLSQKEIA